MYTLDHLNDKVQAWAIERKIYKNSTAVAQTMKLVSEVGELADNVAKGRDARDDIGDCLVCLINIARLTNTNIQDCLNYAWHDIKDRKGYVNELGVFIKEGDNG